MECILETNGVYFSRNWTRSSFLDSGSAEMASSGDLSYMREENMDWFWRIGKHRWKSGFACLFSGLAPNDKHSEKYCLLFLNVKHLITGLLLLSLSLGGSSFRCVVCSM